MSAIPQPRQATVIALYRHTALIRPPYWGHPYCTLSRAKRPWPQYIGIPPYSDRLIVFSVGPSDFDRLISGYRTNQTALVGASLLYTQPCQTFSTALYRDTALVRPPYRETPTVRAKVGVHVLFLPSEGFHMRSFIAPLKKRLLIKKTIFDLKKTAVQPD